MTKLKKKKIKITQLYNGSNKKQYYIKIFHKPP